MPLIAGPDAARAIAPSGNPTSAMARRRDIQSAVVALFDEIMVGHGRVAPELKMLLAHVVSGVAGCRFCQAHTAFHGEHGTFFEKVDAEFPERIDSVWDYGSSPLFSEAERAALDLAVGAGFTPNGVSQEVRARAREFWDDGELTEIVAIISFFGITNRWHDTVATPLELAAREYAGNRLAQHGWEVGKH